MKQKKISRGTMVLFAAAYIFFFAWLSVSVLGEEKKDTPRFRNLPDSLALLYEGNKHDYTLAMIELARLMGASFEEAYSKNFDVSLTTFKDFGNQYRKVASMVPEWTPYFQQEPLRKAEELIRQGASVSEIRGAAKGLEAVCTKCHVTEMFKVFSIFHWRDFRDITIVAEDGKEVGFHEVMIQLSNLLAVIPNNVERNDFKGANEHYKDLTKSFTCLEISCSHCHQEPRQYFVDQRIKSLWYRIGGLLRKGSSDPHKYQEIVNDIYARSCIPCHRIHMPAAFMQMYLGEETSAQKPSR